MTIVLVVAAHPDDEVLGCGGTLARHAAEHDEVNVLFLADGETSRDGAGEADVKRRKASAMEACGILGTRSPTFLDLPDNQLDTVPFLEIVKKIEAVITSVRPEIGYTHHGGDLNIDHRIAQNAFLTAARPLPDAPSARSGASRYRQVANGSRLTSNQRSVQIATPISKTSWRQSSRRLRLTEASHLHSRIPGRAKR